MREIKWNKTIELVPKYLFFDNIPKFGKLFQKLTIW